MNKKELRKEIYDDLEFFLSNYRELKPRFHIIDEIIEDFEKELKDNKE